MNIPWGYFFYNKYTPLDFRLKKLKNLFYLELLHNAHVDYAGITYVRKRLVIPIKNRVVWEWSPNHHGLCEGYVDGELILYPVDSHYDWLLSLSGEQLKDSDCVEIKDIEFSEKTRKTSEGGSETYYDIKLNFLYAVLPSSLEVILSGSKRFPTVHYRDLSPLRDWSGNLLDPTSGKLL